MLTTQAFLSQDLHDGLERRSILVSRSLLLEGEEDQPFHTIGTRELR